MSLTLPADDRALGHATRKILRQAGARLSGRYRGPDPTVRRESFDVDDARAQVAKRICDGSKEGTLGWIDAYVRTAQEYDDRERSKGAKRPLKASGIRVLDVVLRNHWHDFQTGRIDPALSQIMKATALGKQTVVSALDRLRAHGFLDRVRRTVRIEDPVAGGPTRRQTNNLYFVEVGRLANDVRQRFMQLWARAKLRVVLRAKRAAPSPVPPQGPPPPPSRPLSADGAALIEALARLGNAVDRHSPSPLNGQSPSQGDQG